MRGLDPRIHHNKITLSMDCRVFLGEDALCAFAWQ